MKGVSGEEREKQEVDHVILTPYSNGGSPSIGISRIQQWLSTDIRGRYGPIAVFPCRIAGTHVVPYHKGMKYECTCAEPEK
jgi:hypothetical protein